MKTYRFKQREKVLKLAFGKEFMVKVWRDIVKDQLRSLDLKDLYDYYDFNYNIEGRVVAIRNEILNGNFKAQSPILYRVEKKMGICRQLHIPQPTDALVLQILTETIYPKIKESQPSDNAFYSRDRSSHKKPYAESEYEMNWRIQWKKMQKEIYNFSESKDLIVVTDLTNYFDSINLTILRERILSMVDEDSEVLIDLIFRIIEELSWKPDYLPYQKHGLPTINIEPIRLLGHSLLFEIDKVLILETEDNFTRWMDDITFGVDSSNSANLVLGGISDVLKSRGLALNLSKTHLYNADEFHYHFLVEQNKFIDSLEGKKLNKKEIIKLNEMFEKHLSDDHPQHWGKVTKRFMTLFSKNKINILEKVNSLYLEKPSMRQNLSYYFSSIGYSKKNAKAILELISCLKIYDDISLFILCKAITDWHVPTNKDGREFIVNVMHHIKNIGEPMQFYCLTWLRAKYDHPEDLLKFINDYKGVWQKNAFLRRQVTSVLSRLYKSGSKVLNLLEDQLESGVLDASSVANQILNFAKADHVDKKMMSYLFPTKLNHYSLERFLVLCSTLNSEKIKSNKTVLSKIKKCIKDPYQKRWLDVTYNISI